MSDSTPTTEYCRPNIPTPLGDQLQLTLGLDGRPETFSDWVDALAFLVDHDNIDVGLDMLCTTDDSPHKATFNGQIQHYRCFQDPVMIPFLTDKVGTVTIETESPVNGDPIELTVTNTDITATPQDVVVSFGVAADVDEPAEDVPSPILAYSHFCPYGNVFTSREEYEEWAADVDAITMATDVQDALELARAIGNIA